MRSSNGSRFGHNLIQRGICTVNNQHFWQNVRVTGVTVAALDFDRHQKKKRISSLKTSFFSPQKPNERWKKKRKGSRLTYNRLHKKAYIMRWMMVIGSLHHNKIDSTQKWHYISLHFLFVLLTRCYTHRKSPFMLNIFHFNLFVICFLATSQCIVIA